MQWNYISPSCKEEATGPWSTQGWVQFGVDYFQCFCSLISSSVREIEDYRVVRSSVRSRGDDLRAAVWLLVRYRCAVWFENTDCDDQRSCNVSLCIYRKHMTACRETNGGPAWGSQGWQMGLRCHEAEAAKSGVEQVEEQVECRQGEASDYQGLFMTEGLQEKARFTRCKWDLLSCTLWR